MSQKKLIYKNVVCLVYDKKSQLYTAPLTFYDVEQAKDWFQNILQNEKDKSSFVLYQLGFFYPESGKIIIFKNLNFLLELSNNESECGVNETQKK